MTGLRFALGAVLLAGCYDSGALTCWPSNSGPGCVVPIAPIVIDGDGNDWFDVPVQASGEQAMPAELTGLQVARGDGVLYVKLVTDGPATFLEQPHRPDYTIEIGENPYPHPLAGGSTRTGTVTTFEVQPTTVAQRVGPYYETGQPPVQFAVLGDGIELAIPLEDLAMIGGGEIIASSRENSALAWSCWEPGDVCVF